MTTLSCHQGLSRVLHLISITFPLVRSELMEVTSSVRETEAAGRKLFSELAESPADDREFFSESPVDDQEFFSESPVYSDLVRVCTPRKNESAGWQLEINGQNFWSWRDITNRSQLFDLLQRNLAEHGYRLAARSNESERTSRRGWIT